MQDRIVVDASALAALLLPEPFSDWVENTIRAAPYLYAPSLIVYEFYNVMWKKLVLLKTIDEKILYDSLAILDGLLDIIMLYDHREFLNMALDIARKEKITVYDASYLALALKLEAEVVTLDFTLKRRVSRKFRDIILTPEEDG